MKRLLLNLACLFTLIPLAQAASPITGYVQVNPPISPQVGQFNISSGTVSTFTVTGLSAGGCVQATAGSGLFTTSGVNCNAGGGGTGSGTTNSANQYSSPYYSLVSSNVLSGLVPGTSGQVLTTAGSSAAPFWGPAPLAASSATATYLTLSSAAATYLQQNTLSATLPIILTGGVISASPISLSTGVTGILPPANLVSTVAYTSSSNTWTAQQTFNNTIIISTTIGIATAGTVGSAGQCLTSNGAYGVPYWGACGSGGGGSTLPLPAGATNYIWVTTGTLQPSSTFYVSSGTVQQQFTVGPATAGSPFGTTSEFVMTPQIQTTGVGSIFLNDQAGVGGMPRLTIGVSSVTRSETLSINGSTTQDQLAWSVGGVTGLVMSNGNVTLGNNGNAFNSVGGKGVIDSPSGTAVEVVGHTKIANAFAVADTASGGPYAEQVSTNGIVTVNALIVSSAATFNGQIAISSTMVDGSGLAGSSGYVLTSNGAGTNPTWQVASGGGGASTLATAYNGVKVTSPTVGINFLSPLVAQAAASTTTVSVDLSTTAPSSGSANYVQIGNSLQASSTFYVSSGTVNTFGVTTLLTSTGTTSLRATNVRAGTGISFYNTADDLSALIRNNGAAGKQQIDITAGDDVEINTTTVAGSDLALNSISVVGLTSGQCVQTTSHGTLSTSGSACASTTGFGSLSSTQTWTGQNNWTTPAQSTFTYGVTVGSLTVNGSGAGQLILTEGSAPSIGTKAGQDNFWADSGSHSISGTFNGSASTYTLISSSFTPVANQYLYWVSGGPNGWVVGSTAPAGSGSGGGGGGVTSVTASNGVASSGGSTPNITVSSISLSSQTVGILPDANLSANVDLLASTAVFTGGRTYQSSATFNGQAVFFGPMSWGANPDPTVGFYLNFSTNALTSPVLGFDSDVSNTPTAASTSEIELYGGAAFFGGTIGSPNGAVAGIDVTAESTNKTSLGTVYGLNFTGVNAASGTVTNLYASKLAIGSIGGGTVTNEYGLYVFPDLLNGSTVTTNTDFYASKPFFTGTNNQITTNYAMYIDTQTSPYILNSNGIFQVPNGGTNQLSTTTFSRNVTLSQVTNTLLATDVNGVIIATTVAAGSGGGVVVPSSFTWPGVIASSVQIIGTTTANLLTISTSVTGVNLVAVSSIPAVNQTDYLLKVSSTSGTIIFGVTNGGNVISSGTLPAVSSCGTSPSIDNGSTNMAGTINTGSGSPTACTLTFANGGFITTPTCVVSDDLQTSEPAITTRSNTGFTLTLGAALNSGHIFYICVGGRGG